jgi:hypothetical protein
MVEMSEAYAARSIRYLELWEEADWRIKAYGIAYRRAEPQPTLVAAARELALRSLPRPGRTASRYGLAFAGVHEGRGVNLVFVDWWAEENELRHRVFMSAPTTPAVFEEATAAGMAGCIWDLAVIDFERRAWVATMLLDPRHANPEAYLACRFDSAV